MKEGFYSMTYTGQIGSGFGMVILDTGIIVGADILGGTYDGEYAYNEKTGMLDGKIKMTIPAGVSLVTGAPPMPNPHTQEFSVSLPRDLGGEQPVEIQTPTGPVVIVFRKVREFPT